MGAKYSCCGSKAKRDVYNVERRRSPNATATAASIDNLPNVDLKHAGSYHATRQDFVQNKAACFYNDYEVTGEIGVGTYGEVKKVVHKLTGQERAVKIVPKSRIDPKDYGKMMAEVQILLALDHPFIMRIFDVYEDDSKFYIICEYLKGGELFDRIIEDKGYSEANAAKIMYQVLSAIAYCHKLGVIHRDLKPENILYTTKGGDTVKIVDFGLAQTFRPNQRFHGLIGTAYYIAPEVIASDYNEKCDVWSCGVILYVMLSGQPPFGGTEDEVIYQEVKKGIYDFDHPVWEHISREAKKFIKRMMKLDVNKRYSAVQALQDPWIKKYCDGNPKDRPVAQEALSRLSGFRSAKKLQEAVWVFLVNIFSSQEDLNNMRQLFEDLDINKDGLLGKSELVDGYVKIMGMPNEQAEVEADKILACLDFDHDGNINYSQFLNAVANKQIMLTKERLESAFNYFDKNKDGYITADELKSLFNHEKIRQLPADVWTMWINEVDRNHDGKISLDEFKNMMINPLSAMQSERQLNPLLIS